MQVVMTLKGRPLNNHQAASFFGTGVYASEHEKAI